LERDLGEQEGIEDGSVEDNNSLHNDDVKFIEEIPIEGGAISMPDTENS